MVGSDGFIFALFFLGVAFTLALAHIIPNLRHLLYIYVVFNRHHKKDSIGFYPSVNMFVPCKGVFPRLKGNLEAIARQEYENFTVTFITESKEDPANQMIAGIVSRYRHCQHIISGPAVSCGQKNYNLLKGIAQDSKSEIFVFCDSDIHPFPKWLSMLVSSLKMKDVSVTTGFLWITPSCQTLANTLHSMIVAYLGMFVSDNSKKLIWGGAMAIRSQTFKQLRVMEEWSRTVSDDLTLSRLLHSTKLKKIYDPRCLIVSNESISSIFKIIEWFTRQILFLKFYLPSLWRTALVTYIPSSLIMMMTIPVTVLAFFHDALKIVSFGCVGFSLTVMLTHTLMKLTYRDGQSVFRWFLVSSLAQWIATYCLVKTIFIQSIQWANVIYRLDQKGKVIRLDKEINTEQTPIDNH